MSAVLASPITK